MFPTDCVGLLLVFIKYLADLHEIHLMVDFILYVYDSMTHPHVLMCRPYY